MRRVGVIPSLLVLVLLGRVPEARAEAPTPAPSATELAEKAKRAHDLGRLDEAIEGYARAYQVSGESVLLFSLADAHREAGHHADALRIFQTYLRRDPQGVHHEAAEKHVKELERMAKKGGGGGGAVGIGAADKKTSPPVAAPAPTPAPAPVVAPAPKPASPPPVSPAPAAAPPFKVASAPPAGATVDLTAPAAPSAPADQLPLPRWVPLTLAIATVGLGVSAIAVGTSANNRYDELAGSCGQTVGGCASGDIDGVKSRALTANVLWALTAAAAAGTVVSVYLNVNAAGLAGVWRF